MTHVCGSGGCLIARGGVTHSASAPPRAAAVGGAHWRGPLATCRAPSHTGPAAPRPGGRGFPGKSHDCRRKPGPSHTSHKSSACGVQEARPGRAGPGSGPPSRHAPSQDNQYHFPVLEPGNYEGERLPDLSPALHYFADIKINCLILGKHMLQFRLSALVCSGIICIDLPASSQFCLLTSWIIRAGALGELKAGTEKKYEEE